LQRISRIYLQAFADKIILIKSHSDISSRASVCAAKLAIKIL
jgi:hypothetical protein